VGGMRSSARLRRRRRGEFVGVGVDAHRAGGGYTTVG
jgi:hypothetical protein